MAVPLTDPFTTLTADSSMELRTKIRYDYAGRH